MHATPFAVALSLLLTVAAPQAATAQPLPLLDVPFLSQSEALCGGAAAAMVLRYWGEREVVAEDFASLIEPAAGGIRTSTLVVAIQDRGWRPRELDGTPASLQQEIVQGRPIIALIEDRPGVYHYVVVVGWHDRGVVIHDPARNPFRVMDRPEFERRWKAARSWALVMLPPEGRPEGRPLRAPSSVASSLAPSVVGVDLQVGPESCDAQVTEGVRLAQQNDLPAAERVLANASYRCSSAAPFRELAGVRALQRRWQEVGELATAALRLEPGDEHASRLLATSRFIENSTLAALDAWNAIGEPQVELVQIEGLSRTRYSVVEQYLGIPVDQLLTSHLIEQSNERLKELPAVLTGRVTYVPKDGRAAVRVTVVERPLLPSGLLTYATIGARAVATRELAWNVTGLTGGGERVTASWRFWPNRPRYAASLAAPTSNGIWSVEGFTERQPFTSPGLADAEQSGVRTTLSNWASGRLRWEARAGADDWRSIGRRAMTGGALGWHNRSLRADLVVDAWFGRSSFASTHAIGGWRSAPVSAGRALVVRAGIERVAGDPPLDLWAAADTTTVRPLALRAHPVLDSGRLRVDRLGRTVSNISIGIQQQIGRIGPIASMAAVLVDAGRTSHRPAGAPMKDADVGVGLRLSIPGIDGTFRADAALGLRDRQRALTLSWSTDGFLPNPLHKKDLNWVS